MDYLLLAVGLLLLLAGGEFLVQGAVTVARRMGVSPLFIGLTLVGFGTSSPELVASLAAAIRGSPGIAIGNVIGSNIANILLILGAAGLISALPCDPSATRRDGRVMLAATLALVPVLHYGKLSRPFGVLFLAAILLYVGWTYRTERRASDAGARLHEAEAAELSVLDRYAGLAILVTSASLAAVISGGALLVDRAIAIAAAHGISESVIGVSLVAVGTSLPELAVSVLAARRGHGHVAVGNILGSNIYNVLFILGMTALVHPIEVPADIAAVDVWVMVAATLLLLGFMHTERKITRREAGLFLLGYALYLTGRFH